MKASHLWFGVLLAALVAGSARSEAGELRLRVGLPAGGGLETSLGDVEVTVSAEPVDDDSAEPSTATVTEASVKAPGTAVLQLLSGSMWRVRAQAEGFWGPEKIVWISDGATQETLPLWPTAEIRGRLVPPRGDRLPATVEVSVRSAPGAPLEIGPAEIDCSLADGAFACDVPAGLSDVKVRAEGFVSHYLWKVRLEAGEKHRLGKLPLRRGASLVGWVTSDAQSIDGAKVLLRPRFAEAARDSAEKRRRRSMKQEIIVDKTGFFHFEGLSEGAYELFAKQRGQGLGWEPVRLYENAESELPWPLRIPSLSKLEVFIEPPQAPDGSRWKMSLHLNARSGIRSYKWLDVEIPPGGSWETASMPGGSYQLRLEDASGKRWYFETFELDQDRREFIELPVTEIEGSLRLGGEPLSGEVVFGGEFGGLRVPIASDEEGHFEGILPRAGEWKVTVTATSPPVRRNLSNVIVPEDGSSLDIDLPDTVLYGEVVDEWDRPVEKAIIDVRSADQGEFVQVFSDETGAFEARGLAPGPVQVRASARGADSESVELELEASSVPSKVLRLVVRKRRDIRTAVVGPHGPVPGARLLVETPPKFSGGRSYVTGADGHVEISVPVDTRELEIKVLANGYAARILAIPVDRAGELVIPVAPFGGTLTVDLPADGETLLPVLVHPAGELSLAVLTSSGWNVQTVGLEHGRRITVADLESAQYSVCLAEAIGQKVAGGPMAGPMVGSIETRCASGFLPPSGELRLAIDGSGTGRRPGAEARAHK